MKTVLRRRNGKLVPVYAWAVKYSKTRSLNRRSLTPSKPPLFSPMKSTPPQIANPQNAPGSIPDVEDDLEYLESIQRAATGELEALKAKLKKEALDASVRPEQPVPGTPERGEKGSAP